MMTMVTPNWTHIHTLKLNAKLAWTKRQMRRNRKNTRRMRIIISNARTLKLNTEYREKCWQWKKASMVEIAEKINYRLICSITFLVLVFLYNSKPLLVGCLFRFVYEWACAVGLIISKASTTMLLIPSPVAVISLNEWSLIKLIDFGCYQLVEVSQNGNEGAAPIHFPFGLNENLAFFFSSVSPYFCLMSTCL